MGSVISLANTTTCDTQTEPSSARPNGEQARPPTKMSECQSLYPGAVAIAAGHRPRSSAALPSLPARPPSPAEDRPQAPIKAGRRCARSSQPCLDTVAERLRRWTANPLGSPCAGSNPVGVDQRHFRGLLGRKDLSLAKLLGFSRPNLFVCGQLIMNAAVVHAGVSDSARTGLSFSSG